MLRGLLNSKLQPKPWGDFYKAIREGKEAGMKFGGRR